MNMKRRHTKDIVNDYGVEMTVALREEGDRWGLDGCLVWDKEEPIVEVYLKDSDFIISSYYYNTFFKDSEGIMLDGSNSDYTIHDRNKEELIEWVSNLNLPEFEPALTYYG